MLNSYRLFCLFIIAFIIFPIKNLYSKDFIVSDAIDPYCNGVASDSFFEKREIKNIEIIMDEPRRWVTNAFRILVEFNSNESKTSDTEWFNFKIDNKYKKKFDSNLIVNFKENKLSCKFKAKVRVTGDLWWHIDWKNGTPLTSMHVKLLDGHINNITTFKLFIPKAREGGKNEIFVSSFLRELGFLAPRTFMVSSKINGVTHKYIFQEDLRKEFLENAQLVEGPLLEGDERLTVDRIKDNKMIPSLSLSRIINKNFSLKGESNRRTALSAVSALNLIYLQSHQTQTNFEDQHLPYDRLHVNTDIFFLSKSNKNKFQTYEALIYALDAYHGQSYDDRRFYFDPILQNFQPIYYDGKSNIINDSQKSKLQILSTKASIDAKKGASKAIRLINNINHEDFREKLVNLGTNLSKQDYKILIEKIIKRLNQINNSSPREVKFLKTKKYFSEIQKEIAKNRKLIFVNFKEKEFYLCTFDLKSCTIKESASIEFKSLLADVLSQNFSKLIQTGEKASQYLFVYDDINYDQIRNSAHDNWSEQRIDDQFVIKYNEEINLNVFSEKRTIEIEQTSNSGRVIITGKKIENWNIEFNGNKKNIDPNIPNDYLNLTGCLTLLDIEMRDININSKNSPCEDSINFIRANGEVKTVSIYESASDALDIDFSNVKINLISINSAKNDCLDLSYGTYIINKIEAQYCGDKAISIGEKSNAQVKEININQSNIAVAAKDSSTIKIDKSTIIESPICFSAYRKKQEFSGAEIKILKTNCKKEQFFSQKGSKIIFDT
tara:strand:- start:3477 stop:5810 length:2334 start_codon:yes stop_codon:yes gene_type:complete